MKSTKHPLVSLYFARKALSEIGVRFDESSIDDYEAQVYLVIANKIAELESQAAKGKHGSRHSN